MSDLSSFFESRRDQEATIDLLDRFEGLKSRLQENSIEVKPISRFYNYREILEAFDTAAETAQADNIDFRLLRQANYEISLLSVIVDELSSQPQIKGWRSEVKRLISG